jgi:hypothetical protein
LNWEVQDTQDDKGGNYPFLPVFDAGAPPTPKKTSKPFRHRNTDTAVKSGLMTAVQNE